MPSLNPNFANLASSYLFAEIARRTKEFHTRTSRTPIRLGIGNTTEPLTPTIVQGLGDRVAALATKEGYSGYGDEQGEAKLKTALGQHYSARGVALKQNEIFVNDGAKPDLANIQFLFHERDTVAVQNPVYPVYVDVSVINGRAGKISASTGRQEGIVYLDCSPENNFFPTLTDDAANSIIYFCSPNNPTGAVATRSQLEQLVNFARGNNATIIFDSAYAPFIRDPTIPRSIYEVPGADECAIEISSFSKVAGFTGVRLGWTIIPDKLSVEGSEVGEANKYWNQRVTRFFNGAGNIAQSGGLAALSKEGQTECEGTINFYLENARLIREGLGQMGLKTYGGENAPYVWLETPGRMGSWAFFDKLLYETDVVGTPGAGFGSCGEGFLRLSAFGSRENVERAINNIQERLII